MNTQHTPGPWTSTAVYNKASGLFGWGIDAIKDDTDTMVRGRICDVPALVPNHDRPTQEANARLIAQAPALLEALRTLYASICRVEGMESQYRCIASQAQFDQARAAIAAATGAEQENAGCDECGTSDRMPGSKLCSACAAEFN